jgi:soluble lytic murein transglycosylase-like protein
MVHAKILSIAALIAFAEVLEPASCEERFDAFKANGDLAALIAKHAAADNVPEELVRRVIKRESGGNPRAVHEDNYGLMQIKLATARGLGYRGDARGLLDADTNMTYAVKYLAGAYRVADGDMDRAVQYYAAGYYYAAKRKGLSVMDAVNSANDLNGALAGHGAAGTCDITATE